MDEKLEKLFKGANGYILGAISLIVMAIIMLYLVLRFIAVWAIPPLTP